tara:strand:+ start:183 stop:350 length:168 start_codon:yes stop_codon:yes gene_type:complete
VGYFKQKSSKRVPEIADLNLWIEKKRGGKVRVKGLKEVDVDKAAIVYECSVSGLG